MLDKRFIYADTISINRHKMAYVNKGVLNRQGVGGSTYAFIDLCCGEQRLSITFLWGEDRIKTCAIECLSKLYLDDRRCQFSIANALTEKGIISVARLTRLPFKWISARTMHVNIEALYDSN